VSRINNQFGRPHCPTLFIGKREPQDEGREVVRIEIMSAAHTPPHRLSAFSGEAMNQLADRANHKSRDE